MVADKLLDELHSRCQEIEQQQRDTLAVYFEELSKPNTPQQTLVDLNWLIALSATEVEDAHALIDLYWRLREARRCLRRCCVRHAPRCRRG